MTFQQTKEMWMARLRVLRIERWERSMRHCYPSLMADVDKGNYTLDFFRSENGELKAVLDRVNPDVCNFAHATYGVDP